MYITPYVYFIDALVRALCNKDLYKRISIYKSSLENVTAINFNKCTDEEEERLVKTLEENFDYKLLRPYPIKSPKLYYIY